MAGLFAFNGVLSIFNFLGSTFSILRNFHFLQVMKIFPVVVFSWKLHCFTLSPLWCNSRHWFCLRSENRSQDLYCKWISRWVSTLYWKSHPFLPALYSHLCSESSDVSGSASCLCSGPLVCLSMCAWILHSTTQHYSFIKSLDTWQYKSSSFLPSRLSFLFLVFNIFI